jgi:hypothetical protein
MSIAITLYLCGGPTLSLALFVAVHRRLDGLPLRIWSITRKETP